MKRYEDLANITTNLHKDFLDGVSKHIDEYQKKGLQVEVTYQFSMGYYSANILAFREVSHEEPN